MSDTYAKHIVLEKIRLILSLLRKSSICLESSSQEHAIVAQLKSLQYKLRDEESNTFDPIEVIGPFVGVLRASLLAGPYKSCALDAIQTFVSCNILCVHSNLAADALAEIVDAVTRCKFIQTDVNSDNLVQLRIVQVLQSIVNHPIRKYLTDETAWNVIESCYSILLQSGPSKATLYQVAEQTLLDYIHFIFATASLNDSNRTMSPISSTIPSSFGLPVSMKVLGYFVNILLKYSNDTSPNLPSTTVISSSSSIPITNIKTPNRPVLSRNHTPLMYAEVESTTDVLELVLALKAVHAILLGNGDLNIPRDLILTCRPLASLVRDDLCRSLILLTAKKDLPSVVLQHVLGVVLTLFTSMGTCLRLLTECFFQYVFLKSLHQLLGMLKTQEEEQGNPEIYAPDGRILSVVSNLPSTGYSEDDLELILECLCDVLSYPGILPSLFASFDCDPTKPDIATPLVHYLGKCARIVLSVEGPELGSLREAGNQAVSCFMQVLHTLVSRCEDQTSTSRPTVDFGTDGACEYVTVAKGLRQSRQVKAILTEASKRFVEKPKLGLVYLQSQGALPSPLTPKSVAKFLRIAPDLPREAVGSFLGELGKDTAAFEADSKSFHEDVLSCYVSSFEFDGLNLVSCMRLFLSAFRLPGEAQQIDRILVKFSDIVHSNCQEGVSGLLENAEITYLLSFSIIMLNTDRHNPNIRIERKMTCEQFIRNNTNYGADLKQTKPLSQEFLESIYNSIAEFPIRTEKNDVSGTVTQELWMDLQLQAEIHPEKGAMISTSYPPELLQAISRCLYQTSNTTSKAIDKPSMISSEATDSDALAATATERTLQLLTSDTFTDPLILSAKAYGGHGLLDEDLVKILWKYLLTAGLCPFILERLGYRGMQMTVIDSSVLSVPKAAPPESLRIGIDLLVGLLQLAAHTVGQTEVTSTGESSDLLHLIDLIPLILADCAGFSKGEVVTSLVAALGLDICLNPVSIAPIPLPPPNTSTPNVTGYRTPAKHSAQQSSYATSQLAASVCLDILGRSIAARAALGTLLQLCRNPPTGMQRGWSVIWYTLSTLRDSTILPKEMVLDPDTDLLPNQVRFDFEERLQYIANGMKKTQHKSPKKKVSILSLQGLGDAFFGTGGGTGTEEDEGQNTLSGGTSIGRWDEGYEEFPSSRLFGSELDSDLNNDEIYSSLSLQSIRDMVSQCGVSSLISDSRFLSESALQYFVSTLIVATESKTRESISGSHSNAASAYVRATPVTPLGEIRRHPPAGSPGPNASQTEPNRNSATNSTTSNTGAILQEFSNRHYKQLHVLSSASIAWLEQLLVETAVRNRDRFIVIWPLLAEHYRQTLVPLSVMASYPVTTNQLSITSTRVSRAIELEDGIELNVISQVDYAAERRVIGLFKIATRMIGREQALDSLIEVLGQIFGNYSRDIGSGNEERNASSSLPVAWRPLTELAAQVAASMWRLLTQNVSVLPLLKLEQWQIVFDIIASGSDTGGYAAIKSFETMAWLIHEPRLRAEVPVFCVAGIRPLLRNLRAPVSVSMGGIHLLSHLHSRLEVLINESENARAAAENTSTSDTSDSETDTPMLWESCWLPILQAMSEAATDTRLPVRAAAVSALSHAILDKHAMYAPVQLMTSILETLVAPVAISLGGALQRTIRANQEESSANSNSVTAATGKTPLQSVGSNEENGVTPDQLEEEIRLLEMLAAIGDEANGEIQISPTKSSKDPTVGTVSSQSYTTSSSLLMLSKSMSNAAIDKTASGASAVQNKGGPTAECLSSLCKAILHQLPKLSTHQTFSSLWSMLLVTLGYFLGSPSHPIYQTILGTDDYYLGMNKSLIARSSELQATCECALEQLKNVLLVASASKLFEQQRELWQFTNVAVSQMSSCPQLLVELFPEETDLTNGSNPFVAAVSTPVKAI